MALLAPYNNAMRIGQGFNSYTHTICIDDAVVIDPTQLDNPITNDGFTMRDLILAMGSAEEDDTDMGPTPDTLPKPDATVLVELEKAIATLEKEVDEAEDPTSEETKKKRRLLEQKRVRLAKGKAQIAAAINAIDRARLAKHYAKRGPSQIVTYNSRFINKLSEVTDDMNISGSLSIKYGTIGGSGKGAFIDTDKFKESDINFYISVKVVNQTINMKDALVFQGIPGVNETSFNDVFGDSFISGFLEGGEFNALVSMKILSKEKKTDIQAQAQVALTVGPVSGDAAAIVDFAKSNIQTNTETTIQVSWSGGGNIKKKEDPWTVDTLMAAAAAFPELVATTPQRTYAILTKYEALRSYQALKPPALIPLFYENATIYTNALLDAYMDYKNIYRRLQSEMAEVQAGLKEYEQLAPDEITAEPSTVSSITEEHKFKANYKGADLAKRAAMFQMMKIVKEVDAITKRPDLATDEARGEQFQSSLLFSERIPKAVLKKPISPDPLEPGIKYPPVYDTTAGTYQVAEDEKIREITEDNPQFGECFRLGSLLGSATGQLFCGLDFIKPAFAVYRVSAEVSNGALAFINIQYTNGLIANLGTPGEGKKASLTIDPYRNEKIIACSIETGRTGDETSPLRITAFRLYTNRAPDLVSQADDWAPAVDGRGVRGGIEYRDIELQHFDALLEGGYFKGLWGWHKTDTTQTASTGIYRLGVIWGSTPARKFDQVPPVDEGESQVRSFMGGTWDTSDVHPWNQPVPNTSRTIPFNSPSGAAPDIFYGLSGFDTWNGANTRFRAYADSVTAKEMRLNVDQFGTGSQFYQGQISWLAIPRLDRDILTGTHQVYGPYKRAIKFTREFSVVPKVIVWINGLDVEKDHGLRLDCIVDDVTTTSFSIAVNSWATAQLNWVSMSWLAFTPDSGLVTGQYSYTQQDASKQSQEGSITFPPGKFTKVPILLTAFKQLYLNYGRVSDRPPNLRVKTNFTEVTTVGAKWEIKTWADSQISGATAYWIAIPQKD